MADDFAIDPTQVPDDEEQRRRAALLTMPPRVGLRPITLLADPRTDAATSGNAAQGDDGLSPPFRALVRNPGNLLMPGLRTRLIGSAAQQPSTEEILRGQATAPDTPGMSGIAGMPPRQYPPIAGGYQREPGSGLVLRARGDAQGQGQPQADPTAPLSPAAPAGGMPAPSNVAPIMPGPAQQRYAQDLASPPQEPQDPRGLKGVLYSVGQLSPIGRTIESRIKGTPQNYRDSVLPEYQRQIGQEKDAAELERQQQSDDLNRRNVESQIADRDAKAQPDSPTDKKLDTYVNDQGQQTLIFQRPDGSTYEKPFGKTQGRQTTLTSPFEAFAYGTPDEKKAAQDFLTFEKKAGTQYEKPGEIEQRYELYKRDPEAYKAMFGDRGAAQDQTQSSRMLQYFDRRRKEITDDWTLDEPTRAQQLAEIDQLEQPFLNPTGGGQPNDRVTVVSPNGQQGTVPRSQLGAAQKKGYKLAQ